MRMFSRSFVAFALTVTFAVTFALTVTFALATCVFAQAVPDGLRGVSAPVFNNAVTEDHNHAR